MHRRFLPAAAAGVGLGPAAAQAPSAGPPGYRLDDCAGQRKLSAEGRAQAARLPDGRGQVLRLGRINTAERG